MQEIAVEHEDVARVHLDVDELEPFQRRLEMLLFDDSLIILADVIEAAELVEPRALEAAIFARGPVKRYVDAHHVRRQATIVYQ